MTPMIQTYETQNNCSARVFETFVNAENILKGYFDSGSNSDFIETELYTGIDWFEEVVGKIKKLESLKKNWDSYKGLPIDKNLISAAVQILNEIKSLRKKIPKPFVGPVGNGGIDIQWDCGEKFFSIKLRVDGGSRYFCYDRKRDLDNSGSVQIDKAGKVDGREISNIINDVF